MASAVPIQRYARTFSQMNAVVEWAVLRGIRVGTRKAVALMRRRTRRARPAWDPRLVGAVASRKYLNAWDADELPDGAVLFNSRPYAGVVDEGLAPGLPPPPWRIVRWMVYRFGMSAGDASTWRQARYVARAIGRRGLRARGVMTEGVEETADLVVVDVVRSLDDAMRRYL